MATYYAALSDRVFVWEGGWTQRLVGHDIECIAASGGRTVVGTDDAGLQLTTDGGETWERIELTPTSDERPIDRITSVAVSPHDPEVVWAGTEPSAVFRSGDGGESWVQCDGLTDLDSAERWSYPPRPHTHHVRWLELAPDDPDTLYVAIEAGAFVRTTDGGTTWVDHPTGGRRDNHTLTVHPDAPERVYTAAGDGYALSPDRGRTWTYPTEGLEHRYGWSVAVHPDDPDTVVVSAASGPRTAHSTNGENYVYRTTGERWRPAMDGLPSPDGLARVALASDESGLLALTNHGLFRSDDGGVWEQVGGWDDAFRQLPHGLAVA